VVCYRIENFTATHTYSKFGFIQKSFKFPGSYLLMNLLAFLELFVLPLTRLQWLFCISHRFLGKQNPNLREEIFNRKPILVSVGDSIAKLTPAKLLPAAHELFAGALPHIYILIGTARNAD
jgi:hypothetical protein